MAAAPSKSQPLHNFSLPQLKWAQKNTSSSRRRDSPDHQPTASKTPPRNDAEEEENGDEGKPWNLRPRKGVVKAVSLPTKEISVANHNNCSNNKNDGNINGVKSQRIRGLVDGGLQNGVGVERKEKKRKLWISLSREEIEEDVYALTGSKPARRPRKWPKNVQKQLDSVFPGLYLVGVAADSYRVHDASK